MMIGSFYTHHSLFLFWISFKNMKSQHMHCGIYSWAVLIHPGRRAAAWAFCCYTSLMVLFGNGFSNSWLCIIILIRADKQTPSKNITFVVRAKSLTASWGFCYLCVFMQHKDHVFVSIPNSEFGTEWKVAKEKWMINHTCKCTFLLLHYAVFICGFTTNLILFNSLMLFFVG